MRKASEILYRFRGYILALFAIALLACPAAPFPQNYSRMVEVGPYIGTLRRGLERSLVTPGGLGQRARNNLKYKVGLNAFDVAFPPRTTRRKLTIGAYMRMGGSIG